MHTALKPPFQSTNVSLKADLLAKTMNSETLVDRKADVSNLSSHAESSSLFSKVLPHNMSWHDGLKLFGALTLTRAADHVIQINYLNQHLSSESKKFFAKILSLPNYGREGRKPHIYALGDADGSVGRMVLISIQSGHMSLEQNELHTLANILNNEQKTFQPENPDEATGLLTTFQKDPLLQQQTMEIVENADYHASPYSLIFIGDIIHDRVSCNKDATRLLIKSLKTKDAIFILGNHEIFNSKIGKVIMGLYATDSWSIDNTIQGHDDYKDFVKENFVNCYADERNKIF